MFAYRRKKRFNIFTASTKTRRRKAQTNWRAWLLAVAVVLILAGLFYLIIWSPMFKIKQWSVEGENFTPVALVEEEVGRFLQEKVWKAIPGDNLIAFSSDKVIRLILSSFSEAESVRVTKDILEGVKIIIKGRESAAIWCNNSAVAPLASQATTTDIIFPQSGGCFFADSGGLLFREAPEISGIAMPKIFGQPGEKFGIGDRAVASSTVEFAANLKKQLRGIGVEVSGFMDGGPDGSDLLAYISEKWLIYFSMMRQSQPQVKILAALLAGKLEGGEENLKYVDLRVEGRVYYK